MRRHLSLLEPYQQVYCFMESCIDDLVEREHSWRVLQNALLILATEADANPSVVILGALLHDIGKEAGKNHVILGSEKALAFLRSTGWPEKICTDTASCISTHSRSSKNAPTSLEGRILYDADKLDTIGAEGLARCIILAHQEGIPLYDQDEQGLPLPGKKGESSSLMRDYRKKLCKLPKTLYTAEGKRLAVARLPLVKKFFKTLEQEAKEQHFQRQNLFAKYGLS